MSIGSFNKEKKRKEKKKKINNDLVVWPSHDTHTSIDFLI